MKKLVADLHTHTIVSGHAYGTIREMAAAAAEKELKILGISEHAPGIPGTVAPFYYGNLQVIPRILYGVKILHGCEVNVLSGGRLSLEQQYLDWLDYAIAGIHRPCYEDEGREKNTENVIACMKNEKIRFISHPDDDHTPFDYVELVKAAEKYQVALEVNNSSLVKKELRQNCYENYKTMLQLCMKHGVHTIVNSDAHDPSWVGEFRLAEELLSELKFDESLILNNNMEKVEQFLLAKEKRNFPEKSYKN